MNTKSCNPDSARRCSISWYFPRFRLWNAFPRDTGIRRGFFPFRAVLRIGSASGQKAICRRPGKGYGRAFPYNRELRRTIGTDISLYMRPTSWRGAGNPAADTPFLFSSTSRSCLKAYAGFGWLLPAISSQQGLSYFISTGMLPIGMEWGQSHSDISRQDMYCNTIFCKIFQGGPSIGTICSRMAVMPASIHLRKVSVVPPFRL